MDEVRRIHSVAFVERLITQHEAEVDTLEKRILHLENTLREVYVLLDNMVILPKKE